MSQKPARKQRTAPSQLALEKTVLAALEDMKAHNIQLLDVRSVTDIADTMIIASGTSDRHVRSIADRVVQKARESGTRPMGMEGTRDSEWVLIDLRDVLVHVMLPRVREFYALEQLWEVPAAARKQVAEGGARPKSKPKPRASGGKRAPAPARKPPPSAKPAARRRPPRKAPFKPAR